MAAQFQSPHPPTGCDVVRPAGSPSRLIPIPAPPTGCDHEESRVIGTEGEFQSPHPYGMRRDQGLPRLRPRPIPIPTSLRDATASFSLPCPTSRFQSPHPYGMRRRQSARRFCDSSTIPIPTSLRDATSGVSCRRSTSDSNPRIPTGCDTPLRAVAGRHASFQSPHPYGMRQHSVPSGYMYADSNPRIPTGCDGCGQRAAQATGRFQSPHPYGMRQSTSTRGYPRNYSNPHIPTGCDLLGRHTEVVVVQFQSPHPYGMRQPLGGVDVRSVIIPIPTSLRDATEGGHAPRRIKGIPIPTSLRDATATIIA